MTLRGYRNAVTLRRIETSPRGVAVSQVSRERDAGQAPPIRSENGPDRVREILHAGDRAAWTAAALALALGDEGADSRRAAAADLLASVGLTLDGDTGQLDRRAVAAEAAAPLLQTAALLTKVGQVWADQTDAALLAQGQASAQGARAFVEFGLPMMPGLAALLAAPGARMLDVGTGVAALAVAYAECFPTLDVVGLDVLPRVLRLAEATVKASSVADRITLREQDVSTLDDLDAYALAWLPAPFIPETALRAASCRVACSLVPGGWVMLGHGKFADDPIDNAVSRFKTIAYGGTALDAADAQTLLREAGLVGVTTVPTPPGAPAVTLGQRPDPT
jgi:O-methyltransferase domain